jgi:Repeat of Unknown Function (DUF347)
VNPVLTFWVAYILTRPIGASFADFFGMPKSSGGLGIGHGPVALVSLALVVACIAYLARTGKDQPTAADLAASAEYAPPVGGEYGPPQPAYAPPQPGRGPSFTPAPGYEQGQGQDYDPYQGAPRRD